MMGSKAVRSAILAALLSTTGAAVAEPEPADAPRADEHADTHGGHVDEHTAKHGDQHGQHGEAHGAEHVPTFHDVNWFYGFLGEKDDVEPSLLWRPKGMPVPFGALALNSAILYYLLIRFGKKPIGDALKARKLSIMKGMDEAAKVKSEAEARLADYESKLANIDQELERIRRETREAGEAERARILKEAKERQDRMERDARILIDQELKAAREILLRETAVSAVRSAESSLRQQVGAADQERLGSEYLGTVRTGAAGLRGRL